MITRKFGRIQLFDGDSRNYPIRTLVAGKKPRSYTWRCYATLDQGTSPACTGYAVAHEAAARPVVVKDVTNELARKIYRRAQQLDPWEGEAYEGSSVLAAIQAGQELGWYKEYRWAFGIEDAILAISYQGPGVAGINWYEGMEETDKNGFVQVAGSVLGGHAILINGVNIKGEYVKMLNSWGPSFGDNGTCKLAFPDFERLLYEDGEFCVPVKRMNP